MPKKKEDLILIIIESQHSKQGIQGLPYPGIFHKESRLQYNSKRIIHNEFKLLIVVQTLSFL